MLIKEVDDRFMFVTENDVNCKYRKYIEDKSDESDSNDNDLIIASLTGKYIVDTVTGKCSNCGIQYSVSSNSIIWICPICETFNKIDDLTCLNGKEYTVKITDADSNKLSSIVVRK